MAHFDRIFDHPFLIDKKSHNIGQSFAHFILLSENHKFWKGEYIFVEN